MKMMKNLLISSTKLTLICNRINQLLFQGMLLAYLFLLKNNKVKYDYMETKKLIIEKKILKKF